MDIQYLKGVGEKRAQLLRKLGIDSVDALLRYYPRTYTDYKTVTDIAAAPLDTAVCIKAEIVSPIEQKKVRSGMIIYTFTVADETGDATVTLFNRKYIAAKLKPGETYLFYGKLQGGMFLRQMSSPEIHEESFSAIHPVYHVCEGLSSATLEKIIRSALQFTGEDPLPEKLREKYRLTDLKTAICNIHFPPSEKARLAARRRLIFEELFVLQTGLALAGQQKSHFDAPVITDSALDSFATLLPYPLTSAQKRVIGECISDMQSGKKMNRLIQGDVGCGKTAVAAALMFACVSDGYQTVLMAPTEILAEQHYKTLKKIFADKIKIELLTGSLKKSEKERIKRSVSTGETDILIGTHAVIEDNVAFFSLALVITDEQHRFGVEQRDRLSGKSELAHTLVMSATPIPRTLGLIIYGDLDISIIDELPVGRAPVDTFCVDSSYRTRIYNFIKKNIADGRQGYIICPLVEENESNLTSAEEYFKQLSSGVFSNYKIGLLHGKMPVRDKSAVMKAFEDGNIQLLIATTVIEVGVDVPNANVLVIENAERFGLSQLHQLRGRVGRGSAKAYCVLVSDDKSEKCKTRLNTVCSTSDGFKIADADLEIRGPGDFLGHRQHGLPDLKIAALQTDINAMRVAQSEARAIIMHDSTLYAHPTLKKAVNDMFKTAFTL